MTYYVYRYIDYNHSSKLASIFNDLLKQTIYPSILKYFV